MKKIILLLLFCLVITGCKASYSININNDLSVDESMVGLEDESFYKKYYNSSKDRVIEFSTVFYQDYLNKYNYSKEKVIKGEYTGQKVSTTFKDLQSYFDSSEAYKQFYKEWEHSIENGVVTISLKDKLEKNGNCYDRYIIDECDVSITLPFTVMDHNADNYNKETNTYTWNINIDEKKDIHIKFDTNKISNKTSNKNNSYIKYIFIGGLLLGIIIIIMIYLNKKGKANEF